jgi:hypothetical protein
MKRIVNVTILGSLVALFICFIGMVIGFVFESSIVMKTSFVGEIVSILLASTMIIGNYISDTWTEGL